MGYNTKTIVTDGASKPISQYYNPLTDEYEPIHGRDGANSFVQLGTVAEEVLDGDMTATHTFETNRHGFSIVNDGTEDLTFTINSQTRKVKPGESYSALFRPFKTVTITATTAYRAEVLS